MAGAPRPGHLGHPPGPRRRLSPWLPCFDLCAIIVTEGAQPDQATIDKANEENITILSTSQPSFYVVGKLWEMGLREK